TVLIYTLSLHDALPILDRLVDLAEKLVESTGYENVSLSSLSSCDYSELYLLISKLMEKFEEKKVGVSLPSLRLDTFIIDVLKEIDRKSTRLNSSHVKIS